VRSLFEKINKYILYNILGKKYIRQGKCKECGRCCQSIYVRHSRHVISDEEEFEKLKNQHFFYSYLKIVDKNETGLVFECKKLDKTTGKCTAYKQRASICRNYPQEEVFMMGGTISAECGFNFTPIQSFEEVLKKVSKGTPPNFKSGITAWIASAKVSQ
jgi:hypothetical protein